MSTNPVTLDQSTFTPLDAGQPAGGQAGANLRQSLAYGVQQNADEHAKLLKQQQVTGMAPEAAKPSYNETQNAIEVQRLNPEQMVVTHPRTAAWATNPDNAAVAHDDMGTLTGIETHRDSLWGEAKSALANYNTGVVGFFNSFINAGGVAVQGAGETGKALLNKAAYGENFDLGQSLHDIWVAPRTFAVQKYVTQPLAEHYAAPIIQGGKIRGIVNSLEQAPGQLAAMYLTGGLSGLAADAAGISTEAAGVEGIAGGTGSALEAKTLPAILGTQAAQNTYVEARAKGADQKTAILTALQSGMANYALMGEMPGGEPASTRLGTVGQWAGRSVGMGATMAVSDNAIARTYDPQRGLFEGMAQSIATMAAFEGVGALSNIVDLAGQSKLKARSQEKFEDAMRTTFGGDASLRIPVAQFDAYFKSQQMDPGAMAAHLESTNYAAAALAGGEVEVPAAAFVSKLDAEHQKALLPDIVDPVAGRTIRQEADYRKELQDLVGSGSVDKLAAEFAQADAETQTTPEWQKTKSDFKQQLMNSGSQEPEAEHAAALHANAVSYFAKNAKMKPEELVALQSPEVVRGEAPEPAAKDFDAIAGTLPSNAQSDGGRTDSTIVRKIPKVETPGELKPYDVARVPIDQLDTDPKRFQYKMNTDASGVTNLLKGQAWNEDNAGVISVWRDPEDGKTYVVNGHHRFQLAKETGRPDIAVRMIGADSAEKARAKGALQNIAEGRGTAMDAAKFFRDTGASPAELARLGVSMGEAKASNGMALAKLHPLLFDQVVNGQIPEGRAVAIGNATADPAEQEAILKLIEKNESKGKHVTNETVNELARMVKGAGQHTETQDTLFGSQETTHSLALEKAEVSSYIRKTIGEEQRTFASVSSESKAAKLSGVEGQTINAAKNSEIAGDAAMARELYDRLSVRSGTVDEILNRAAREIAEGKKPNDVKARAYADTRDALREAFTGGLERSDRVAGQNEGGSAAGEQVPGDSARADARDASDTLDLFHQTGDDGQPRAWVRMLPDGRYEIGKTPIGDVSHLVHEPAHIYLNKFAELTQREGASDVLKSDFKTICEWLGTTPEEIYKNGFTREQHEQFAKGSEQFVREGKAPTAGLRRAFHTFGVWLQSIYRRASDLGVEISAEVREVMGRMYAGDTAVDRAEMEAGKKQLFESPEEAGWTEEQFKNYADAKGVAVDEARAQVAGEMNAAAERDRTEAWREEKKNVRDAVTEQVDSRPEYTAIRSLRRGQMDDGTELTLNRDELVKQFGEERVKALQDVHRGLYRNEGGTDAETAAELLGYGSGEEMMKALETAPRRSAAIEQGTRDHMTAVHGDIRYDGSLQDKARLAMENDEQARTTHQELKALRALVAVLEGRAADQKAAMASLVMAPLEHYREAARRMIADQSMTDLQPNRYLNASRVYSRDAFDALRRGDVKAAAEAKNKELLNHFLFREASKERGWADKFESYGKRMQTVGVQQRLGLAGVQAESNGRVGDYREQFNWLLSRYRLRMGAAPQAPERTLRAWADDAHVQGNEVVIAPGILDSNNAADYRSVPLSELHDLHDALINVRTVAMQEFKMFVQGKQMQFAEAKAGMLASLRTNMKSKPELTFDENLSAGDRVERAEQTTDSYLNKMERWIEWADGGKAGFWHDNLWNPSVDAQGDEYRLQAEVTKTVTDALNDMPAEMRRRLWTEKVSVEGIPESLTRRRLLSIAFNFGNEGNLDRVNRTFKDKGWDPEAIRTIGGMLSREEWQFVQKAWESLKPLGARMEELQKRLTGLAPAMVKVDPFRVALDDGTEMDLAGGYYPIKMDPRFSDKGLQQDAAASAQNAMQKGYVRPTTAKGYTRERSGYGGQLLFDYEHVLTAHVAQVAKDLSHREFMLWSQRLLLDPEMRKALRETLGPAREAQFMPWLRTIINDNNGSVQDGMGKFKNGMQNLRSNFVTAALSFNPATVVLQISHAPRMLLYAKPKSLVEAFAHLLANPVEMTREIHALSPNEMRFRGDNLDRDIRGVLQKPAYMAGYSRKVALAGRFALQVMDHLLSHTLWRAAYRDALTKYADLPEGEAGKKAVYEADSAVRLGLGSQAAKDLPAIMRNNDLNKFITTLYGFHSGVYSQLRENAHQARYGEGGLGSRAAKLTGATILSAVLPAVLGSWLTGRGPKEDENAGWWAAKRALLFSTDTIPILRSVASSMETGHDVQFSPIETVLTKAGKAALEATSDKEDKDWMGIGLDVGDAAGSLAGVPGSHQAVKTLRYMKRASDGKIENPNVWNAVVGGGR